TGPSALPSRSASRRSCHLHTAPERQPSEPAPSAAPTHPASRARPPESHLHLDTGKSSTHQSATKPPGPEKESSAHASSTSCPLRCGPEKRAGSSPFATHSNTALFPKP